MKAKKQHISQIQERVKLEKVIPLSTPFTILIEPTDKCNFRCKFCPTGDTELIKNISNRNYGNINFDLYKKIIDDISEFNENIKVLQLHKDGEPLLNNNLPEMVKYAKKSSKINQVATTTNASMLNEELSIKLIDAGLDRIRISIEGINEKQYYDIANIKIDFDKLVKNIEFFYKNRQKCYVYIKIVDNNLSEKDKDEFYNTFGNISDSIFIENATEIWNNFEISGVRNIITDKNVLGENSSYINVCPQIFYSIAINSNGLVSACCADWSRKLIVGDANKESIKNIWNGEKIRNLQKLHLMGNRKNHKICASCGNPTLASTDNIDNYKDELLTKIIQLEHTKYINAEQSRAEQSTDLL